MYSITNFPVLLAIALLLLWYAARSGAYFHKKRGLAPEEESDFGVILAASLTLLSLFLGFSFSMATSRYDLRKNYEIAEANAIDTEYTRADLLPAADAAKLRDLLKSYLDQRILFYQTRMPHKLRDIEATTLQLQKDMWSMVRDAALAQPNPVNALVVTGMNGVFDSEVQTKGAWWNRIPASAWILMGIIAICSNVLVGYGVHHAQGRTILFLVLPFIVTLSFFLIADIDSPRGGLAYITPQNLVNLAKTLHAQ